MFSNVQNKTLYMSEPSMPVLSIHQSIYDKLDYFYNSNKIPNLIFHGPSGSGKRTIVDTFMNKIYRADKQKLKANVMWVNCAHGKGIKFIREELKFFAKSNIHSNNGITFKTIILLNADNLTIDAQSALRRCIELFSYNTRFFIIVENKEKLLNPILSRFCEIYVPEYMEHGRIVNLHQYKIRNHYGDNLPRQPALNEIDNLMCGFEEKRYTDYVELSIRFYELGLSGLDLITWLEDPSHLPEMNPYKNSIFMQFHNVKAEFRCEKLLLLYLFDHLGKGTIGSLTNPP